MKDDKFYLIHIAECLQRICDYTKQGRDAFMSSSLVQDAVIRNFEIMGEAPKHISDELKERFPDIPWRRIAGFRDVLIHAYYKIKLEEVWDTVH